MTEKQVKDVENLVNQKIKESLPVTVSMMTKDQALEGGALALFGEKYGDEVREFYKWEVSLLNFAVELTLTTLMKFSTLLLPQNQA